MYYSDFRRPGTSIEGLEVDTSEGQATAINAESGENGEATSENEEKGVDATQKAATAPLPQDFGQVRSFVFALEKNTTAVGNNFPDDVETIETKAGIVDVVVDKGSVMEVKVAGSDIPPGAQALIVVTIEEFAEKPSWRAYYSESDTEGQERIIPHSNGVDRQKWQKTRNVPRTRTYRH